MKTICLLAAVSLLTGCASLQAKWMSRDSGELIDKFGIPNARMDYAGGEVWQYTDECRSYGMAMPMYGTTFASGSMKCRHRIFQIRDGKVIAAKSQRK